MHRRFIIALILAILPIALLTSGQAIWRLLQAYDIAQANLRSDARAMSADVAALIASAEAVLTTLQTQPGIRAANDDCSVSLAKAIVGSNHYTNLFLLDRTGKVTCSALAIDPQQSDASRQGWWQELDGQTGFFVSEVHLGLVSRARIVTAAVPLFDGDGAFDGALAVGIRAGHLEHLLQQRELPRGSAAALLDSKGEIIAARGADEMRDPFAAIGKQSHGAIISELDASGLRWLIAVEGIGGEDIFLAFSKRESALFIWSYLDVALNILLPLVMLALAFAVIWYSADRFVLRWVGYLQRVARAYGKGHLAFRPAAAVRNAPEEIRQLAAAMGDMAESIRQRDAGLRNALEQRSLMLREIHHRVKNNLQIIGSLLQIEARHIKEPAAQAALKITRTRINAIALAHRLLEEVDAQTVVNLRRLMEDLVRILHDAFGDGLSSDGLAVDAPDLLIETDIAVPLALLMVELLSGIYRSTAEAGRSTLSLDIGVERASDRELRLVLTHDAGLEASRRNDGVDFAAAYLRQLRATSAIDAVDNRTRTSIIFQERSADQSSRLK